MAIILDEENKIVTVENQPDAPRALFKNLPDANTIEKILGDIAELKNDFAQTIKEVKSPNLCNEEDNVTGILQSNGTVDASGGNASYKTSDYIPIEDNESYTISVWSKTEISIASRIRTILYDANKQMIAGSYTNEASLSYKTVTNTTAKYIRFSYYYGSSGGSDRNKCMIVLGIDHSAYVPYYSTKQIGDDIYLGEKQEEQVPIIASGLFGKKWAVCGDSFSYGSESAQFDSGIYAGKNKVYPYFIGNRTGIVVLDAFFASGRTLAYPSDETFTNSMLCPTANCYYQNIPADVDYITVYLGINDNHHEQGTDGGDGEDTTGVITLGTIDSTDTGTYYGAWNVMLTWLRSNRPFAHIGIIVTNGVPQTYREAQIAIAKKYGVPFIDMNGDDITPVMIRSCNADIPESIRNAVTTAQKVSVSNQHPNDNAHEYESHFIENFLRRI